MVGLLIPRVLTVQGGTRLWGLAAAVLAVLSVIFLFVVAVNVLLVNHLTQLFFVTTECRRRGEGLLTNLHRVSGLPRVCGVDGIATLRSWVFRNVKGTAPDLCVGLAQLAMRVPRLHLSHPLEVISLVLGGFTLPWDHVGYGMLLLRLDTRHTLLHLGLTIGQISDGTISRWFTTRHPLLSLCLLVPQPRSTRYLLRRKKRFLSVIRYNLVFLILSERSVDSSWVVS